MALDLKNKKVIVLELKKIAKRSVSAVVVDYRGMNVEKIMKIRKEGRKKGVYIRVIRNNLMRRALEETPLKCIKEKLRGPVLIAFSSEDHPGSAVRIFQNLKKKMDIKAIAFQGKSISEEKMDNLIKLPIYIELIVKLMFIIKEAAVGKFVRTLTALRKKKEAA